MAWTTPATATAGTTATAAFWNTNVRDNLKAVGDPWTSYTPTIANVTTSTVTAKHIAAGKWITVRFSFTLTGAPTGAVTMTLPVTASTSYGTGFQYVIGQVSGLRQGTGYHLGAVYQSSSTLAAFMSGGGLAAPGWNATVPASWANTDIWSGEFVYEAA